MQWTSLKEKYPEKEGFYLCATGLHRPFIAFFKTYKKLKMFTTADGSHAVINNVKYWMNIPEINQEKINEADNRQTELKQFLTDNECQFLIQVLNDSVKLGENENFKYLLITREAMKTRLERKATKSE